MKSNRRDSGHVRFTSFSITFGFARAVAVCLWEQAAVELYQDCLSAFSHSPIWDVLMEAPGLDWSCTIPSCEQDMVIMIDVRWLGTQVVYSGILARQRLM